MEILWCGFCDLYCLVVCLGFFFVLISFGVGILLFFFFCFGSFGWFCFDLF